MGEAKDWIQVSRPRPISGGCPAVERDVRIKGSGGGKGNCPTQRIGRASSAVPIG
jgi:hypothetical protein